MVATDNGHLSIEDYLTICNLRGRTRNEDSSLGSLLVSTKCEVSNYENNQSSIIISIFDSSMTYTSTVRR
jgi:hypothetical protein